MHSTALSALGELFTGPLNYFRGSMSSATNLAVVLPMIDEHTFIGKLFGMIHLFLVLVAGATGDWPGRAVPAAANAADCHRPLLRLRRDHPRGGGGHECFWENELTRNKKILIGVGVAIALGGIAFANFRFKRVEGVTVNVEAIKKHNLKDRVASARSSRSGSSTSAPTRWAA